MSRPADLKLQIGDLILWQGETIQLGTVTVVGPGMVGKVVALHPSAEFARKAEELFGRTPEPGALVQFESGLHFLLKPGMKWERLREQ